MNLFCLSQAEIHVNMFDAIFSNRIMNAFSVIFPKSNCHEYKHNYLL